MNAEKGKESGGVQSAEVALYLLRVLAEKGGSLPLSHLAAAAGMPAAKAHRYVVSLARAGFVEQTGRHGNYRLGPQALRVGLVALGRLDVMEIGTAKVLDLRDRVDQTTLLAIWGDHGPTVVHLAESSHPVTVNVRTGSNMPLLRSATGRVFGGWMTWDQIQPFVKAELAAAVRQHRKMNLAKARTLFEHVRDAGLASVSGDMLAGVQALGAPVFNAGGQLTAVVTVLGTLGAFDMSLTGTVAKALLQATRELSHDIGFRAAG